MSLNTVKNKLRLITSGITLALISPSVSAHVGHNHSQFDSLTGILHTLTTHPLLFGGVGLIFIAAVLKLRQ